MNTPRPVPFRSLPEESAQAIIASLQSLILADTGLHIPVRHELLPLRDSVLSQFVVTLPAGVTPEQRAEINYWANEVTPLFRYDGFDADETPFPKRNS